VLQKDARMNLRKYEVQTSERLTAIGEGRFYHEPIMRRKKPSCRIAAFLVRARRRLRQPKDTKNGGTTKTADVRGTKYMSQEKTNFQTEKEKIPIRTNLGTHSSQALMTRRSGEKHGALWRSGENSTGELIEEEVKATAPLSQKKEKKGLCA